MASAITADKSHKHQGKLLKSGHEEHKKHAEVQPLNKDEAELKTHNPTNEQAVPKPAGSGRKHRNNHHGKNKKGANAETHTGRSRKLQTKPHKQNGQKSHNKNHGRKHGRGKQEQ